MDDEESYSFTLPQEEVLGEAGSYGRRALAFGVDLLIFYIVFFQIFFWIFASMSGIPYSESASDFSKYLEFNREAFFKVYVGFSAGTVLFFWYLSLFQFFYKATPGMMFFSLNLKYFSEEIPFWKVCARNIMISAAFPFAIFDLIAVFFTKNKQRTSDAALGIYVEHKESLKMDYEVYS